MGVTRLARHGHGSTRAVSTRAPSSSPNREGNVSDVTGSCEGALKGLSRMRGNSHVRFFGGRVDWQQSFGPATAPAYPSRGFGGFSGGRNVTRGLSVLGQREDGGGRRAGARHRE